MEKKCVKRIFELKCKYLNKLDNHYEQTEQSFKRIRKNISVVMSNIA